MSSVHGTIIKAPSLLKAIIVLTLVAVTAVSWVVFPIFFKDHDLLRSAGGEVKAERRNQVIGITQYLTQRVILPIRAEVDVLYAVNEYFEHSDKAGLVSEYRPDLNFVFFVSESTHEFSLPTGIPKATLVINGTRYPASEAYGPSDVEHHRTSTYLFPRTTANGTKIAAQDIHEIQLELEHQWSQFQPGSSQPDKAWKLSYSWENPLVVPPNLKKNNVFTPILLVSLSAGLLSAVLTPCLLQLVALYLVTMTGVTAENLSNSGHSNALLQKRIMLIAGAFVSGFIILFTTAGGVVGYAAKEAQLVFAEYSRTVSIFAGILVVILGIWMGIRTRAPLVCRLSDSRLLQHVDKDRAWSSSLLAIAFSLGCISCFGGAIIATLFIYVGSLGSPAIGAAVMLMFSLGISIPFLLAALFLSRLTPMLETLGKYHSQIGLVSMILIIAFGIILITDNFHTLSDTLYPLLGLT